MKKLILLLSIVFAAAMALTITIPALAASSDTVTVTGTVQPAIEITDYPEIVNVDNAGNLIPGTYSESINQTVTVKCNKAGWRLTASNEQKTSKGHMRALIGTELVALINPLEIKGNGNSYAYLNTSVTLVDGTASAPGTANISDIRFRQATEWTDAVNGIYNIIVTFTATLP